MSRTRHLTYVEFVNHLRDAKRRRAPSRLTKEKYGEWYWPNCDRPKNAGNHWGRSNNAGQRRRKEARVAKVLGRRLERRRLNRAVAQEQG
jgi:hypothetical protein